MNPSNPATDFITRRDFMKKSALTVGAITLLSQGIGLASGTGGSSWWDMKCTAPSELQTSKSLTAQMSIPFGADFDLMIATDKAADPETENGYEEKTVAHNFGLNMLAGGKESPLSGKNMFKARCNRSTGTITSTFLASDSNPINQTFITTNYQVGLYSVDLTIYIVRDQGGPDLTTKVFGSVYWEEILKRNNNGSFRIPEIGALEIVNTFKSTLHSG